MGYNDGCFLYIVDAAAQHVRIVVHLHVIREEADVLLFHRQCFILDLHLVLFLEHDVVEAHVLILEFFVLLRVEVGRAFQKGLRFHVQILFCFVHFK